MAATRVRYAWAVGAWLILCGCGLAADAALRGARASWFDDVVEDVKDGLTDRADDVIDLVDDLGGDETAEDLRDALHGDDEDDAPAVLGTPPRLALRPMRSRLDCGDRLLVTVNASEGDGPFDLYLALLAPGGTLYFLDPRGALTETTACFASSWSKWSLAAVPVVDLAIPAGVPDGTYTLVFAALPVGGDPWRLDAWTAHAVTTFTVDGDGS